MSNVNKYGLSRNISETVKREVRQRCGFGCVVCGNAIYQYEHVDPPYAEAKEHNAEHIVLLCGGCHDRVTRGILSKQTIQNKSLNPKCKEQSFSFGPFDIGNIHPEISVGTFSGKNVETIIRILGDDVLSVRAPICQGQPFLINAKLCDRDGRKILEIVDNEWRSPTSNWDIEVVGTKITIRKKLGDVILILRTDPPYKLIVERLDMEHRGVRIRCSEGQNIEVVTPDGQILRGRGIRVNNCKIGINIDSNSIAMGVGGGSTHIEAISVGQIPISGVGKKEHENYKELINYLSYLEDRRMNFRNICKKDMLIK